MQVNYQSRKKVDCAVKFYRAIAKATGYVQTKEPPQLEPVPAVQP